MDGLSIFALFILCTLITAAVALAFVLGGLPGRIATERGHRQAEAVRMCGWMGVATLGILWPIALVWSYMRPIKGLGADEAETWGSGASLESEGLKEQRDRLKHRLEEIEKALGSGEDLQGGSTS